jgi:hypothetical protein
MSAAQTLSPFQRLLGAEFARLPAAVRELHSLRESAVASGCAEIAAAASPAATLVRWFAGLPRPGRDVPVSVAFYPDGRGGELWERRFASRRYASTMMAGTGGAEGLLVEHFGLFRLFFQLTPAEEGLVWRLVRWRFLGVPLPRWTIPSIECVESAEGARFVFDIDVSFPVIGPVTHYRGWIERSPVG